jgi:hypothetical protein
MKQPSVEQYRAAIAEHTRTSAAELRADFENLATLKVELPPGEQMYWVTPRDAKGEWRFTAHGGTKEQENDNSMLMLPMLPSDYSPNAYLQAIPQVAILHSAAAATIEQWAANSFRHFPAEKGAEFPGGGSLASRAYDVPMVVARADVIVKMDEIIVQGCEVDDASSLWAVTPEIQPIAESYLLEAEAQIGKPIYTAELFHYKSRGALAQPPVPGIDGHDAVLTALQLQGCSNQEIDQAFAQLSGASQEDLARLYAQNDSRYGGGEFNDIFTSSKNRPKLGDVALMVRAYRDMPGFQAHMDKYGPRSLTMAWERDSKWHLVAERLGALASNLNVAFRFARSWYKDHPDAKLVFKGLHGARTDATAIGSGKGTKLKGVSSENSIWSKFGKAGVLGKPVVVQPFLDPDTLEKAGVEFIGNGDADDENLAYTDRKHVQSYEHIGKDPGKKFVHGKEDSFSMIFRIILVYLPREKRVVLVGGLAQATDGRIVHGGAHSATIPLYIDGLGAHRNQRNGSIRNAEEMLEQHGHKPLRRMPSGIILADEGDLHEIYRRSARDYRRAA